MFSELTYVNGKLIRNNREVGWTDTNGYRYFTYKGSRYLVHRVVWYLHKGHWPTHHIDHINQDRLDNRIENLRDVTRSVNLRNQKKIRGFYHDGVGYRVTISVDNRTVYLGRFRSKTMARKVYLKAKQESENGLDITRKHVRTR